MGSSGSGQFGTYHVQGFGPAHGEWKNGSGGGGGEIHCPLRIELIRLEDVAISEYYTNNGTLPEPGEEVELNHDLYKGRLVVSVSSTGEILGNLPTKYNYLISCLMRGINYYGYVESSGYNPIPFAVVTLHV